MKKPTPKPIRERAWVRLIAGVVKRHHDGAPMVWSSAQGAREDLLFDSESVVSTVEVEIRSVPRKARKRARRKA
jgi:hypothetical protein